MKVDQSLFVLNISEDRRGCFPSPALGFGAGDLAHLIAEFLVFQLLQTLDVSINITGVDMNKDKYIGFSRFDVH